MFESITAARTRAALVTLGCMVGVGALAQPALQPETAPPSLPRLPHLAHPDVVPYPDYYALARSHTALMDDPQFRPLRLRLAGRQADPAFIVLPVQTEAFAFRPAFRALVGARLDQELARRHIDASGQTDIVDWRGPFVRRTDDATVAAFAGDHPQATLLTPYLGHDGEGHAYLSLSRRSNGQIRVGHRQVAMARAETDTLAALGAALPGLLAELDLGEAAPAASLAPARADGCIASHWTLADLPPSAAPDDVACHAILMATLMPDYYSRMGYLAEPSSPDRLAWLARAWIEAASLESRSPAMHSVAQLAAVQLLSDSGAREASDVVDSRDVVVRPLARMLWAHQRVATLPVDSTERAAEAYLRPELVALPPFAKAVLQARSTYAESFHRTDLCPLQLALPHFRIPPGCDDDPDPATPARTTSASLSEIQLMETWRLATAWSDLYVEGTERGSAKQVATLLDGMPASIATHPFIRQMRFFIREFGNVPRDAAGHLAWAESTIRDFAQVIATLQRDDPVASTHAASEAAVFNERSAPGIYPTLDDLDRLATVVDSDSNGSSDWPPHGASIRPATFLADGSFANAKRLLAWQGVAGPIVVPALPVAVPPVSPPPPSVDAKIIPAPAISPTTFSRTFNGALPARQSLEAALATQPADMRARMVLALVALEHGEGTVKARQILDSRPRSMRGQDAIGETDDLFGAGSVFYFSGELAIAREYYVRAAAFETGSAADMGARARIALIDGDIAAARREYQRRAQRYDDDFAVAQEAGYLFMAGRSADAWPMILGRALTSKRPDFWRIALSGHRIEKDALTTLPAWLRQTGLERVTDVESGMGGNSWINACATLDRLPNLPDADTLRIMGMTDPTQSWARGVLTRRAAIAGSSAADAKLIERDATAYWFANQHLLPFYAWALWNMTGGNDASLDIVRDTPLEAGFGAALSKAMVLAADGRREESLRSLTAARYELGRLALFGTPYALRDPLRTAPYDFVLATWLMSRKTGEPAYAAQGLAVAEAYQHFEAWVAWPYAAEALLGKDAKAREIAACRAQKLDADSMFLHESGLHPDPKSAVCRKATAW